MSFKEIMSLDLCTGLNIIRNISDEKIYEKIDNSRVHGINPEDSRMMGTDFYSDFMSKKRAESEKNFLENIDMEERDRKIDNIHSESIERIRKLKHG